MASKSKTKTKQLVLQVWGITRTNDMDNPEMEDLEDKYKTDTVDTFSHRMGCDFTITGEDAKAWMTHTAESEHKWTKATTDSIDAACAKAFKETKTLCCGKRTCTAKPTRIIAEFVLGEPRVCYAPICGDEECADEGDTLLTEMIKGGVETSDDDE